MQLQSESDNKTGGSLISSYCSNKRRGGGGGERTPDHEMDYRSLGQFLSCHASQRSRSLTREKKIRQNHGEKQSITTDRGNLVQELDIEVIPLWPNS